ncbi:TPA: hypothetical protein HA318_03620 [Candidatus Micrarchaeota archaeon]|nr:MAG: hypothetical protein AUJ65_03575 [Candidatus Micrarchaeota archaeon CG1_02_51_15]HII39063.1 hypothetical protein [Candidatus Micrarchaeota archaeon]
MTRGERDRHEIPFNHLAPEIRKHVSEIKKWRRRRGSVLAEFVAINGLGIAGLLQPEVKELFALMGLVGNLACFYLVPTLNKNYERHLRAIGEHVLAGHPLVAEKHASEHDYTLFSSAFVKRNGSIVLTNDVNLAQKLSCGFHRTRVQIAKPLEVQEVFNPEPEEEQTGSRSRFIPIEHLAPEMKILVAEVLRLRRNADHRTPEAKENYSRYRSITANPINPHSRGYKPDTPKGVAVAAQNELNRLARRMQGLSLEHVAPNHPEKSSLRAATHFRITGNGIEIRATKPLLKGNWIKTGSREL